MVSKVLKITSQNGLHTRPASNFVKKAKEFQSDIVIRTDEGEVSAKSLFKLQTLELSQGKEITLVATGPDESEALEVLVALLETLE